MRSAVLLNAVSAATAAPTQSTPGQHIRNELHPGAEAKDELTVQVVITGVATVRLFGRLHRDVPWVQLGTDLTAGSIVPLPRIPFLFAQAVSVTSGTVTVHAAF